MRYLDSDQRREIEEAKRQGMSVVRIAERLHMEASELCQLMHWPQWQEIPAANMVEQPDDYLWSCDKLDAVL